MNIITEQKISDITNDLILMEMDDNITGSQYRLINNTIDILYQLYDENQRLKNTCQSITKSEAEKRFHIKIID